MLRLRQICLVAEKLAPVEADIEAILGLKVCYRDPGVGKYGLENVLYPIGRDFLEVVAPVEDGTAAGRYLERRGGDGGYIVILQCDDGQRRRDHYASIGIRIANGMDYGEFLGTQLHPKDTGGCMLEVDRQDGDVPDGAWRPAGEAWESAIATDRVTAMTGCTLQSQAPAPLATRWASILERDTAAAGAAVRIGLDNGGIDFVAAADDRGDGLIAIAIKAADPTAILKTAAARGLPTTADSVTICGTRFDLT